MTPYQEGILTGFLLGPFVLLVLGILAAFWWVWAGWK